MRIAITGSPGVGKTTLCLRVFEALKRKVRISGFVTREVRKRGSRIGFVLRNLANNEEIWLARVGAGKVRVGKYAVFVEDFEKFLEGLDLNSELLIIDEVGPMELKSSKFSSLVLHLLKENCNILATVHRTYKHRVIEEIKGNFKLFTINKDNRELLTGMIIRKLEEFYNV